MAPNQLMQAVQLWGTTKLTFTLNTYSSLSFSIAQVLLITLLHASADMNIIGCQPLFKRMCVKLSSTERTHHKTAYHDKQSMQRFISPHSDLCVKDFKILLVNINEVQQVICIAEQNKANNGFALWKPSNFFVKKMVSWFSTFVIECGKLFYWIENTYKHE